MWTEIFITDFFLIVIQRDRFVALSDMAMELYHENYYGRDNIKKRYVVIPFICYNQWIVTDTISWKPKMLYRVSVCERGFDIGIFIWTFSCTFLTREQQIMAKWQQLMDLLEKKKKLLMGFSELLGMFREIESIGIEMSEMEVSCFLLWKKILL